LVEGDAADALHVWGVVALEFGVLDGCLGVLFFLFVLVYHAVDAHAFVAVVAFAGLEHVVLCQPNGL
jgi:hypothetical protein